MEKHVEDLKKFAVKIWDGQCFLGSGVLWKPEKCEKNRIYVFTAAHNVKGHEEIEIEFLRENRVISLTACKHRIAVSETYRREGDDGDAAVIALDYEYDELPGYMLASFQDMAPVRRGTALFMYGFPKDKSVLQDFKLSGDSLDLVYEQAGMKAEKFEYRVCSNVNPADRNGELPGFSGSGIFYDAGAEYVLLGIHRGAFGPNAERGNVDGTASDVIRNICLENQWDVPVFINRINGSLSDQELYFQEEILDSLGPESDFTKIVELLDEICQKDMTEVINSVFYNYCEECAYRDYYYQCGCFRKFLLVLSVFLKAVNEAVDLTAPHICMPEEVPVYFVCSEGRRGNKEVLIKMSHFICALKEQKELAHQLEEQCIVIWASRDNPRDNQKKCNSAEYKNVLHDITRRTKNRIHITEIYKEPCPRAIIHIDELVRMLQEGKTGQMKEMFIKYIKEIINDEVRL